MISLFSEEQDKLAELIYINVKNHCTKSLRFNRLVGIIVTDCDPDLDIYRDLKN